MLELTPEMMTGVAKIDEQHKELVNRINAVVAMGSKSVSAEETSKTISFLGEYVIKHFNDEESLQRQYKYPQYESHKRQHQLFINDFKKLKEEFAANGPSATFSVHLNSSVVTWIIKHIKQLDVEFGKYCKTQQ